MNKLEFQTIVGDALARISERTVFSISKADERLKEIEKENAIAEDKYNQVLEELKPEQKEVIQNYVDTLGRADTAMNDCSYIAGICDCVRFLLAYKILS